MNKKLLTVLLALILCLTTFVSLVACDENGVEETEPTTNTGTSTDTEGQSEPTTEVGSNTESQTDDDESSGEDDTSGEGETKCEHPYASSEEGHWKPECSICGKGKGRVQDHEYKEFQEDEGDLIYYSYVCTVCNYVAYGQDVPYEINLFYPASEIANLACSSGFDGSYNFVSGIGYGSFANTKSDAGGNATVVVENSGSLEDEPVGQYMALKVRMPRSQNILNISVKTVHADQAYAVKLDNVKPGWLSIVIDMAKLTKSYKGLNDAGQEVDKMMGYKPDASGDFYLQEFKLSAYVGAGESLDIAYVLFCEDLDDAKNFIENENNYFIYHDPLNSEPEKHITECKHDYVIDNENGTHTLKDPCFICGTPAVVNEKHAYIEIIGGGKNSYECAVCGYAKYLKVVPETINKYVSASELNAGGVIYYPYSGFNHGLYIEPNDAFTRYEGPLNWKDNVAQVIFARDDADQNPTYNGDAENGIRINVGDAIYFVLRVRVNTDNLSPLSVTISTTEHAGFTSGEGNSSFSIPVAKTDKDTWNVYVVNLKEIFPTKYIANADGDYIIDTFYFTMCQGTFDEGVTLDLSYMAYCSDWDEVAAIVDEEQLFYLSDSKGNGNWTSTEDRKCIGECGWGRISDGNNYVMKCGSCGALSYDYKVDTTAAARFLNFADTIAWGNVYNSYTRTRMVEEGSPEFLRYTNANGLAWGDQHAFNGLSRTNPGQYLVLKVRLGANGNGQTYVQCYFSSKASTASWDKGGVAFKVTEDNEWHTVVINLAERITTGAFAPNADGTYNVDYMYTRFYGDVVNKWDSDDYFDIAYVAVCDSLEDVSKLTGSDTYEYSVSSTESIVKDSKSHQPVVTE